MSKKSTPWETVGSIAVDSGTCWIGDPCYFLQEEHRWENWLAFVAELEKRDAELTTTHSAIVFPFDHGAEGMGICTSTGWGDGEYPVEVRRTEDGRVAELRVVFIEDDQ